MGPGVQAGNLRAVTSSILKESLHSTDGAPFASRPVMQRRLVSPSRPQSARRRKDDHALHGREKSMRPFDSLRSCQRAMAKGRLV